MLGFDLPAFWGWLVKCVTQDLPGLTVNMVSSVPFMLFDVVILTLLLPFVLRISDEFNWRNTRQVAGRHLLKRYESADNPTLNKMLVSPSFLLSGTKVVADAMDQELQTVLGVMGPKMGQDFLMYHLSLKRLEADMNLLLNPLHTFMGVEGETEQKAHVALAANAKAIFDRVAMTTLIFHQLVLKYGAPNQIARAQRDGPTHLNGLNELMLREFVKQMREDTRGWWEDYLVGGWRVKNATLVRASKAKPVTSLDRTTPWLWLIRRNKQPQLSPQMMVKALSLEKPIAARLKSGLTLPTDWAVLPNSEKVREVDVDRKPLGSSSSPI